MLYIVLELCMKEKKKEEQNQDFHFDFLDCEKN